MTIDSFFFSVYGSHQYSLIGLLDSFHYDPVRQSQNSFFTFGALWNFQRRPPDSRSEYYSHFFINQKTEQFVPSVRTNFPSPTDVSSYLFPRKCLISDPHPHSSSYKNFPYDHFWMWIIWESNMMNPSQSCLKRNTSIRSDCSTIWILILHMTSRKIVMRKNKRWIIRQSVLYRQVCINDQTTPFCAKCHSFFFFILVSYICVFRSCCITFFSSSSSILTALHIISMRFSFLSLILKHLLTIIQSYTRSTASSWMFARQALAVSQIEQWSLFVSSDRNVLLKNTKFVFFFFPYTYSKRDLQSFDAVDSHHDNWEFIVLHSLIDIVTDDYHVSNLVRSDSIVSIFLESVLLVNCHSYFSNRYHRKLAVYVCRFPCAQWSQRDSPRV